MSDTSLNKFVGYGTNAERIAFTPSPATIAAAPKQLYLWYTTDTTKLWGYDTSWHDLSAAGTGDVTHTGTLTSGKTIIGNGTADITVASLTAQFVGSSSGTAAAASMTTARLLGRTTASSGAVEEISVGTGLSLSAGSLTATGGSVVVQVKNVKVATAATGTTTIPYDNTKPQKTEGDEYMTLAITPTDAAHMLLIQVLFNCTNSANVFEVVALFQDAANDALNAVAMNIGASSPAQVIPLIHYMTAGTTSATTFKVRAGGYSAGTTYFNAHPSFGTGLFDGVMISSITITEIIP